MRQLQNNAIKLGQREINPLLWQEGMNQIYGVTPLEQLKEHGRFPELSKAILEKMPADRGEFYHTAASQRDRAHLPATMGGERSMPGWLADQLG